MVSQFHWNCGGSSASASTTFTGNIVGISSTFAGLPTTQPNGDPLNIGQYSYLEGVGFHIWDGTNWVLDIPIGDADKDWQFSTGNITVADDECWVVSPGHDITFPFPAEIGDSFVLVPANNQKWLESFFGGNGSPITTDLIPQGTHTIGVGQDTVPDTSDELRFVFDGVDNWFYFVNTNGTSLATTIQSPDTNTYVEATDTSIDFVVNSVPVGTVVEVAGVPKWTLDGILDPDVYQGNALTTAQRDALTAFKGYFIYNDDDSEYQYYDGTTWKPVGSTEIASVVTGQTTLAGNIADVIVFNPPEDGSYDVLSCVADFVSGSARLKIGTTSGAGNIYESVPSAATPANPMERTTINLTAGQNYFISIVSGTADYSAVDIYLGTEDQIDVREAICNINTNLKPHPSDSSTIFGTVDADALVADLEVGQAYHFQTSTAGADLTTAGDPGGLGGANPNFATSINGDQLAGSLSPLAIPAGVQGYISKDATGNVTVTYTTVASTSQVDCYEFGESQDVFSNTGFSSSSVAPLVYNVQYTNNTGNDITVSAVKVFADDAAAGGINAFNIINDVNGSATPFQVVGALTVEYEMVFATPFDLADGDTVTFTGTGSNVINIALADANFDASLAPPNSIITIVAQEAAEANVVTYTDGTQRAFKKSDNSEIDISGGIPVDWTLCTPTDLDVWDRVSITGDTDLRTRTGTETGVIVENSFGAPHTITYGTIANPQTIVLQDGENASFTFNGVGGWSRIGEPTIVTNATGIFSLGIHKDLTVISNANNTVVTTGFDLNQAPNMDIKFQFQDASGAHLWQKGRQSIDEMLERKANNLNPHASIEIFSNSYVQVFIDDEATGAFRFVDVSRELSYLKSQLCITAPTTDGFLEVQNVGTVTTTGTLQPVGDANIFFGGADGDKVHFEFGDGNRDSFPVIDGTFKGERKGTSASDIEGTVSGGQIQVRDVNNPSGIVAAWYEVKDGVVRTQTVKDVVSNDCTLDIVSNTDTEIDLSIDYNGMLYHRANRRNLELVITDEGTSSSSVSGTFNGVNLTYDNLLTASTDNGNGGLSMAGGTNNVFNRGGRSIESISEVGDTFEFTASAFSNQFATMYIGLTDIQPFTPQNTSGEYRISFSGTAANYSLRNPSDTVVASGARGAFKIKKTYYGIQFSVNGVVQYTSPRVEYIDSVFGSEAIPSSRIGEFFYAKSGSTVAGYLPVTAGTVTNGATLYPLWAAMYPEFVSGTDIVFPADVDGMFLRNIGGNATTEGIFQADQFETHVHSGDTFTSSAGETVQGGSGAIVQGQENSSLADNTGAPASGSFGSETRPDNRAYQLYTIVDGYNERALSALVPVQDVRELVFDTLTATNGTAFDWGSYADVPALQAAGFDRLEIMINVKHSNAGIVSDNYTTFIPLTAVVSDMRPIIATDSSGNGVAMDINVADTAGGIISLFGVEYAAQQAEVKIWAVKAQQTVISDAQLTITNPTGAGNLQSNEDGTATFTPAASTSVVDVLPAFTAGAKVGAQTLDGVPYMLTEDTAGTTVTTERVIDTSVYPFLKITLLRNTGATHAPYLRANTPGSGRQSQVRMSLNDGSVAVSNSGANTVAPTVLKTIVEESTITHYIQWNDPVLHDELEFAPAGADATLTNSPAVTGQTGVFGVELFTANPVTVSKQFALKQFAGNWGYGAAPQIMPFTDLVASDGLAATTNGITLQAGRSYEVIVQGSHFSSTAGSFIEYSISLNSGTAKPFQATTARSESSGAFGEITNPARLVLSNLASDTEITGVQLANNGGTSANMPGSATLLVREI